MDAAARAPVIVVPALVLVIAAPWLVVYDAVSADFQRVRWSDGVREPLPCAPTSQWLVRVGRDDRFLFTLAGDAAEARRYPIATFVEECAATHPPDRVALRAVANRGLLDRDRLFVSYGDRGVVDVFTKTLVRERELALPKTLYGATDVARVRGALYVAMHGNRCLERYCDARDYDAPALVHLDGTAPPLRAKDALNGGGLLPIGDTLLWLFAGLMAGGSGAVGFVDASGHLSTLSLGTAAAAEHGVQLDATHAAIFRMSGEHVFIIDVAKRSLVATLQLTERGFASASGPIADRIRHDLHDAIPVPHVPGHFVFVDSLGEQLLEVAWEPPASLRIVRVISVKTDAFRTGAAWAFWVER